MGNEGETEGTSMSGGLTSYNDLHSVASIIEDSPFGAPSPGITVRWCGSLDVQAVSLVF